MCTLLMKQKEKKIICERYKTTGYGTEDWGTLVLII